MFYSDSNYGSEKQLQEPGWTDLGSTITGADMHRGQLDSRIRQLLYQVEKKQLSVNEAAKEIDRLFNDFDNGVLHEEQKVIAN